VQTNGFVFHLAVFYKLLSITKPLSDVLQGNTIDIAKAMTLVKISMQQIKEARTEFESVCIEAKSIMPKPLPVGDDDQMLELARNETERMSTQKGASSKCKS